MSKICIYEIKAVTLQRFFIYIGFFISVFYLDFLKHHSREGRGAFFLCCICTISCSKKTKNRKKFKKMQKNAKKSQKNLHISKICCNFAPSFQMRESETPN